MSSLQAITGLGELAGRYDAVLSDVWGVIHNGRESFPKACAALARWRAEVGPVVLISNAPRPSSDVVPQLLALGVPDAAWGGFVSSGDVTRTELARRAPARVWLIGPERDAPLWAGLDLTPGGPADADFICCSGLHDDEAETVADYGEALAVAAARGLEMVCANPDRVVQRGDRLIPCAGALADAYTALGGRAVMAGKPFAPIYEAALAEAERLAGRPLDRARVLAIGDGLPTDVTGANRFGLPLLFVANGIHTADTLDREGALDLDRTRRFLADAGARADHVIADLAW